MCDYSLQHVASRPAKVGDQLEVSKFANTVTRGLSKVGEPNVAVCILPGTEVEFERGEVEHERVFGYFPNKKIRSRLARFRQVNLGNPHEHHDALEFPNGQVVFLTRLCVGQRVKVLQLPAAPKSATEARAQQRLEVVG